MSRTQREDGMLCRPPIAFDLGIAYHCNITTSLSTEVIVSRLASNSVGSIFLYAIVTALCLLGVLQTREKAALSDGVDHRSWSDLLPQQGVLLHRDIDSLRRGDIIVSIAGRNIDRINDMEFVLDGRGIGEIVPIEIARGEDSLLVLHRLRPYYSQFYIFTQIVAALSCLLLGIFVLRVSPREPSARLAAWLTLAVAALVCFTNGQYSIDAFGLGYVIHALFPSAWLWTGVLLLHFALRFSHPGRHARGYFIWPLYALPLGATVLGSIASIHAHISENISAAGMYFSVLSISKASLVVLSLTAFGVVVSMFFRTRDRIMRRRLMWVTGSIGLSISVYVLFWQLPTSLVLRQTISSDYVIFLDSMAIPESGMLIALAFSALGIAIGVARYRLFDIEALLRRGAVYSIFPLMLLIAYYGILLLTSTAIPDLSNVGFIALSFIMTAVLLLSFILLREPVERFVEENLFQVERDFRKAQQRMRERLLRSLNIEQVGSILVDELSAALGVDRAMLLVCTEDDVFTIARVRGFPMNGKTPVHISPKRFASLQSDLVDCTNSVEGSARIPRCDLAFAKRCGVDVLLLLRDEHRKLFGILTFGRRAGIIQYSVEDIALVLDIANSAIQQIGRLRLQEQLTVEMHESERLRELNRMKSDFVSSVSHDLKTPLTAIRMYTEMIAERSSTNDDVTRRQLKIIEGESLRLSRLVDNILDFNRIEHQKDVYRFRRLDLNELVPVVLETLRYQFDIAGVRYVFEPAPQRCIIRVDEQALHNALTNLLSNALKYSPERALVRVSTESGDHGKRVSVQDSGPGISPSDITHLFDPFFRSSDARIQRHGGVGLGLAIVRHFMAAHYGAIDVQSIPERGSTFTLIFPDPEVT